jgi:hypothetical protein
LYHIINNYENLTEKIIFFQGKIDDHKILDIEDYFRKDNFIGKFNELINVKNDVLINICKTFLIDELEYNSMNNEITIKNTNSTLQKIIEDFNKLLVNYNTFATTDPPPNINYQIIDNQVQRIKDSIMGATKMVLMHVVTGQVIKNTMVEETSRLSNTLFKSAEIDLIEKVETQESTVLSNGLQKYIGIKDNYIPNTNSNSIINSKYVNKNSNLFDYHNDFKKKYYIKKN